MANPSRTGTDQVVRYLRKRVTFADVGLATGLKFTESLPAGCYVFPIIVDIETAFNAGTTNPLVVGTVGATYNDMAAAGDVDELTVGVYWVTRSLQKFTSDTDVYVMFTPTGTAPTAGVATVIIPYIAQNPFTVIT